MRRRCGRRKKERECGRRCLRRKVGESNFPPAGTNDLGCATSNPNGAAEAENERVLMFGAWGSGASCGGLADPLVDGVVVDSLES